MEIKEIDKTFDREGRNSVVVCVKSLLQYFKIDFTQDDLKEKLLLDEKGSATLADLVSVFERFGLMAEGFRADAVSNLDELSNPAIIPVFMDDGKPDFAVYYRKYDEKYLIGMPLWGLNLYTGWEFEAIWVNHVLLEVKKNVNL